MVVGSPSRATPGSSFPRRPLLVAAGTHRTRDRSRARRRPRTRNKRVKASPTRDEHEDPRAARRPHDHRSDEQPDRHGDDPVPEETPPPRSLIGVRQPTRPGTRPRATGPRVLRNPSTVLPRCPRIPITTKTTSATASASRTRRSPADPQQPPHVAHSESAPASSGGRGRRIVSSGDHLGETLSPAPP